MKEKEKSELVWDAMLKVAGTECFDDEFSDLPSPEELNALYPS